MYYLIPYLIPAPLSAVILQIPESSPDQTRADPVGGEGDALLSTAEYRERTGELRDFR